MNIIIKVTLQCPVCDYEFNKTSSFRNNKNWTKAEIIEKLQDETILAHDEVLNSNIYQTHGKDCNVTTN